MNPPRRSPTYRVYQHVLEHWETLAQVSLDRLGEGEVIEAWGMRLPEVAQAMTKLRDDIRRVLDGSKVRATSTPSYLPKPGKGER